MGATYEQAVIPPFGEVAQDRYKLCIPLENDVSQSMRVSSLFEELNLMWAKNRTVESIHSSLSLLAFHAHIECPSKAKGKGGRIDISPRSDTSKNASLSAKPKDHAIQQNAPSSNRPEPP